MTTIENDNTEPRMFKYGDMVRCRKTEESSIIDALGKASLRVYRVASEMDGCRIWFLDSELELMEESNVA